MNRYVIALASLSFVAAGQAQTVHIPDTEGDVNFGSTSQPPWLSGRFHSGSSRVPRTPTTRSGPAVQRARVSGTKAGLRSAGNRLPQ